MQFKKVKEPVVTSDTFYDLFEGGYILPEELLKNKDDAKKVNDAIEVVKTFLKEAKEAGSIEVN